MSPTRWCRLATTWLLSPAAAVCVLMAPCAEANAQVPTTVMVASAPTLETELAATVELLGTGVGYHLEQLGHLGAMVTNIKNLVGTANELFALTRGVKRAYDALRNYTVDDLERDLWEGAMTGMPQLADMYEEIGLGLDNYHGLQDGAFFERYDAHDGRMDRAIRAAARTSVRANVYRTMFEDAPGFNEPRDDFDYHLNAAFARSGALLTRLRTTAAEGAMTQRAAQIMDEADRKGRIDLSMGASSMMAQQQTMMNTTALRHLQEAQAATDERQRQADERARQELGDNIEGFWGGIGEVR